jgi:TFIIF-interacting CTD phosphatase-like protein
MVNIILDLDETLIHTIVTNNKSADLDRRASFCFQFSPQGQYYYVFKRPGLTSFMESVFKHFKKVGIWTAADRQYAKIIVKKILTYQQIMALDFVYSRDFCAVDNIGVYKPLSKVYENNPTWRPDETIMLDNSPAVMRKNPRNGIVAPDYAEPHLDHDIYLYLLSDVFDESLPKTKVYQFIEKTNHVLPYVISLYDMDDHDDQYSTNKFI